MNSYVELKEKQQIEVNAHPFFFAFSDKQFKEGMKSQGLKENETGKICGIGIPGGFIKKSNAGTIAAMWTRQREEREAAITADKDGTGYIYEMFKYELENHEYCITWDLDDTLEVLGLTIDEVNADQRMVNALKRAHDEIVEYDNSRY